MRKIESSGREGSARELRPGLTGAAALAATLLFYLALQPFPDSTLNALFTQRGWVPYGISFLSAWAGVMLVVKFRLLGDHRRALQLDLLPRSLGERITPDNAGAFIEHLDAQPIAPGNPLCQRIRRGLLHFSARRDASQLVGQLGGQAQADADALESSYTLVRVFIWAVPILGFIGTVIGIGAAVGGFSESVGAAVDLDVMKESIGSVTGGLGIAFDTTLVALVMSILIMFPASSLQKAEEDFLAAVEDYTDEQLVVRLSGDDSEAGDPRLIEQAIHREMAGHHAELRAWSERLGQIGEALSAQVVSGWEKIDAQLRVRQEQQQEQLARWAAASQREGSEELAQTQRELLRDFRLSLEGMAAESRRIQEEGAQRLDEQLAGIERLHRRLQDEQQDAAGAQREQAQALIGAGEGLSRTLSRLRGEASEARAEASRQLQHFAESIREIAQVSREVQRGLLEGQEEQATNLRD
ncbi:MAG: MotA/TolQ/ExbB proton channel family protein, partial [Myxococcales bacterium]|nr:MotA/TolQ/ExbB proton channel family protein [Myxococcales bacterium]